MSEGTPYYNYDADDYWIDWANSLQQETTRPNGSWHKEMGYGLVDAYASVSCATTSAIISNATFSSTTNTINGCIIRVDNTDVVNTSSITLRGEYYTILEENVTIEAGNTLLIE